ncbi:hypothetical protein [Helicobacter pylori]|uniref:hypothetical protein n=1 Tax=Helicobacter pylori TaxID=210 RepID=UPI000AEA78F3|nr:hypothetical protein [Helicobacter pylori]
MCFEKGGIQNIEKILQKDSAPTKALNKAKIPILSRQHEKLRPLGREDASSA